MLPGELELLINKNEPNRLGFALLLKFFQYHARFPENPQEIPPVVINYVAKVISVSPEKYKEYDWQGRLIKYHRAQIRKFFGFREATLLDAEELTNWLASQVLIYELKLENLKEAAISRLREFKIEPPTPERLERIIRSAIRQEEEGFFSTISSQLSSETKAKIDLLLQTKTTNVTTENNDSQTHSTVEVVSSFSELKSDPGRIGVGSFLDEINKLVTLRSLKLPPDLFKKISTKILQIYKQRVVGQQPWDLRRHPEAIRYTMMSAFCYLRSLDVTHKFSQA